MCLGFWVGERGCERKMRKSPGILGQHGSPVDVQRV